jgi:hypothetical protein
MIRIAFVLAMLASFGDSVFATEQPVQVTVQELLAHPDKFAGKRVDVTGYYCGGDEDSSLALSPRQREIEQSIWIDLNTWNPQYHPHLPSTISPSESLDWHTIRVIGRFLYQPRPILDKSVPYEWRFRGFGAYKMFARTITDVTYCKRAR